MYRPLAFHYPPPKKQSFFMAHPFLALTGMFVGASVVLAFWQVFLILATLAGVGFGLWHLTLHLDQLHLERFRARQALLARAEYEHHLLQAGDPRGIFGRFPPAC